ncbi:MAG: lipid A deacylase LpxR family protein [Hyphomonadaceae bacterium]|nr:lipid A deacylase LpxR family protein [Hyphomonadaceae bacterium]
MSARPALQRALWAGVAGAAAIGTAAAQDEPHLQGPPPTQDRGVLSFVVENDSLSSGNDRNYTSGVKLAYVAPADVMPDWIRDRDGITRPISGSDPDFWGVAIGQSIFTPEDIQSVPPPTDQHPYAGWLYLQIMMAAEEDTAPGVAPGHLDLYELELGIVGPGAQGRQAQRGIHAALGAPDPQGWDFQLEDEFAFALAFERRWRALRLYTDYVPGGLELDLTPNAGITLGTLRTEAKAGVALRVGYGLDGDYGPTRVRPGLTGVGHFAARPFAWSVFAAVDGRAVGRNLFLDGNTYRDSASVEKRNFVLDAQLGFTVQVQDVRLAYTYVTRTEEFETQSALQDFGALSLSFRF